MLYVIITKAVLSYTEIAQICVRQGIGYLQLREKHLSDRELIAAAMEIRRVTRNTATRFVVNDRADIAAVVGADMLHLGQEDMPIELARQIVGDMPIGLSTHSLEQAQAALAHRPAYIGFGPIFPTTTKEKPDPTVGLDSLRRVVELSPVPVVAIGGIFPNNINEVLDAGAKNVCLVRHLMESEKTEERIKEILLTLRKSGG